MKGKEGKRKNILAIDFPLGLAGVKTVVLLHFGKLDFKTFVLLQFGNKKLLSEMRFARFAKGLPKRPNLIYFFHRTASVTPKLPCAFIHLPSWVSTFIPHSALSKHLFETSL